MPGAEKFGYLFIKALDLQSAYLRILFLSSFTQPVVVSTVGIFYQTASFNFVHMFPSVSLPFLGPLVGINKIFTFYDIWAF